VSSLWRSSVPSIPARQPYRLPGDEEVGEVAKSLAEVLGNRGCVVLGYDIPDQPLGARPWC
jgi:hypothetical protein